MNQRYEYACRSCGHEWATSAPEEYCYKCGSANITRDGSPVEHKPRMPAWARVIRPIAKLVSKGIQKLDEKTTKFWKEMEERK